MIVDDTPAVLHAARELLGAEGIEVVALATTGEEALRLALELRPDVMLVDIDLGPESGLKLVRRLGTTVGVAALPCILISAHAEADYAELIADNPAIGFLSKSDLSADAIRRLLDATRNDGPIETQEK